MDVLEAIRAYNAGRDPVRLVRKYRAMRANSFVFLRGTCHLFYSRPLRGRCFAKAPLVWTCGDLHLENFGSYKGDNRQVYFDLNDFDESALAPATWELVRLLASVLTAAETLRMEPQQARADCKAFVEAYADALSGGHAFSVERETAQGLVRTLLDNLGSRTRKAFLDRRSIVKRKRRQIVCDDKHATVANSTARARASELLAATAAAQANPAFFEVIDVANRIAGTGSLGVERYIILVHGKGSPYGNYLLDLKRALPSSLARHFPNVQPIWKSEAERVVALQRRMQAVSTAFLEPVVRRKKSYVLRGLQPSEDRVALDATHARPEQVRGVIEEMGRLVAWAQLRSSGRQGSAIADKLVEFGEDRKKWRAELLETAADCARQVARDWQTYCQAFDGGFFEQPAAD
jgi:uncharacterized protein (DUF2252 family)